MGSDSGDRGGGADDGIDNGDGKDGKAITAVLKVVMIKLKAAVEIVVAIEVLLVRTVLNVIAESTTKIGELEKALVTVATMAVEVEVVSTGRGGDGGRDEHNGDDVWSCVEGGSEGAVTEEVMMAGMEDVQGAKLAMMWAIEVHMEVIVEMATPRDGSDGANDNNYDGGTDDARWR